MYTIYCLNTAFQLPMALCIRTFTAATGYHGSWLSPRISPLVAAEHDHLAAGPCPEDPAPLQFFKIVFP